MTRPLLLLDRVWPPLLADLRAIYDIEVLPEKDHPDVWLAEHGGRYEAVVSTSRAGLTARTIDRLPRLRVISNFGVGLDNLDTAHAAARGIAFGYTAGVLTDCVADLAFGALIASARRLGSAERFVRRGDWAAGAAFPLATRVSGARLGIVGHGRIGQAVAQRAAGFSMKVRYHSRKASPADPGGHEPDLLALADWADFLVVATPGGPETAGLISRQVIAALGPAGHLVNISRGSTVDEAALIEALESQALGGAALDVYANEPRVPARLLALDNVVLLPHIGSSTWATRRAMADLVLTNLDRFFSEGSVACSAY